MKIYDEKPNTIWHKTIVPVVKNGKFVICKKYKCWIGYVEKNQITVK